MGLASLRRFGSLVLVGVAACAAPSDPPAPLGTRADAIKDGRTDVASKAVVATGHKAMMCSGFFVARDVILTAAHCVADTPLPQGCGAYPGGWKKPGDVRVAVGDTMDDPDFLPVESVFGIEGASNLCGFDVVAIVLKSPTTVTPLTPRLDRAPTVGEKGSVLGFGNLDPADDDTVGTRRRLDGVAITLLGSGAPNAPSGTFDGELDIDRGPCGGDSGGPLLDADGRVVAVMSRGPKATCTGMTYERLDVRAEWLTQVVRDAAERHGVEAPGWAKPASAPPEPPAGPAPAAAPASDGGGCAMAPRTPTTSFGAVLALVAVAALSRRKGGDRTPR